MRFSGLKAVIFDLDDTLTVHQAAYDASYLAEFDAILEGLGVSTGEAVMVGDTFEHDVEGAVAAGVRAVWVDRRGDGVPRPNVTGKRVRTLHELLELVGGGGLEARS